MRPRVGIIGAGVSGLTVARRLQASGYEVTVLDKGRSPGGRASTRESLGFAFDHGAPSFLAEGETFRAFLDEAIPPGVVVPWPGSTGRLDGDRIVPDPEPGEGDPPRLVGVPGIGAVARAMAGGVDVRGGIRVELLRKAPGSWLLVDTQGVEWGPFDWVVSTAPPAQSATLLDGLAGFWEAMAEVVMLPCFSLMLAAREGTPALPIDGIRCNHPVLGWASNEHRKPGRPPGPTLVIHSGHHWAEAHCHDDPDDVARALKGAAEEAFGLDLGSPRFEALHRWLYASPDRPIGAPCLVDSEARLACCGDWCDSGGVEGAFLSGSACADLLIGEMG